MTAPNGLPQTWSKEDVLGAFDITPRRLDGLIRDSKVGYFLGKKRARRFTAEHVAQIQAAIEVKARRVNSIPTGDPEIDSWISIGVPRASAARRVRKARGW